MDTFVLPPSPNWHLSNVLACNDNGLLAYGSRSELSIVNLHSGGKFDVSILNIAHKDKINVIVFSPIKGSFKNCLATCGDDGMVRVWDFQELQLLYCHSGHRDGVKVMGLDWSRADTNRLVSVNDLGSIVCWDLASNTIRKLHCGTRVLPLCLACCPHNKDLVAVGCKGGVTLIVDIKGNGRINHRLRSHEQDVISISWCPVPYNVIKYKSNFGTKSGGDVKGSETPEAKENRDLLLATGGVDKSVYIWRTGTDGRYEVILNLPNNNITTNFPRKKGYMGASTNMVWICVLWVDPYTLLSTSQFGELLSWDLNKICITDRGISKKPQPRLLHSKHHKGCFSIACPVLYDVVEDWKTDRRTVWTTAMDKHVIGCALGSGNLVLDIPTMGGAVISMALSPLDPNRLAVGSSDSKVFIWNMSNLAALDITTYWKKIIGKVMALSWHPTEENILAYGTSDGHVGLLDVGSNKPPTLLRLHHRKAVYRVSWAPPLLKSDKSNDEKLVLYSVGDGDIFQYTADPQEPNEEPKSLNVEVLNSIDLSLGLQKPLTRSDIVFKPDLTCFAVGSDNGSVYIVNCETLAMQHVIYPHKKLMNNLEWHPVTVTSENRISPYKDWLATTCFDIKVYNIPPADGQPELIATLSGHSEKIVGLAWSPHFNGRLLSASYDYSVQIWDVPTQSCLGVCITHSMAVMCAYFSPQDPDIVISGSSDNTVRLWSIRELASSTTKPEKRKGRIGSTLKERSGAQEATELTVGDVKASNNDQHNHSGSISPNNSLSAPASSICGDKGTEDYKKRQKSRAVFTITGPKLTQAKHFDTLYQRWAASGTPPTAESTSSGTPPTSKSTASISPPTAESTEEEAPSASDLGYLDFFGDDKAMHRLLMVEEGRLAEMKQHQLAQHSALWRGDISQMIKEAITKKRLSDWLVSIAPLAGFDVWEAACDAYAAQLVECGEVSKASSYLLATHKPHEAVRLLADYKLFREAVAVAKCRLGPEDPVTAQVYSEWGDNSKHMGMLPLAAHCYLAANDTQACIETLARVKELKSLKMASMMARRVGQTELADSLAVECLTMCVVAGNLPVGRQLITEMPQYQYWSVWLSSSELLAKIRNRSERELFDWLEGRQRGLLSLCDELKSVCSAIGKVYDSLLPHLPTNKTPEFERDMWFCVSGQLAAACAASLEASPAHFLRHTVSALSAAYHHQTSHPHSLALPLTITLLAPAGLFEDGSILTTECKTTEEKQLMKSLKAFVCASIIHWMNNNWEKVQSLLSKSETNPAANGGGDCPAESEGYKMTWLPKLLEHCSADVLDSDSVAFFVKKAQKVELHNLVTKENIQKKCLENKIDGDKSKNKQRRSKGKNESVIEKTENVKMTEKRENDKEVSSDSSNVDCAKKVDENLNLTSEVKSICETADKTLEKIQEKNNKFESIESALIAENTVKSSKSNGAIVAIESIKAPKAQSVCSKESNVDSSKALPKTEDNTDKPLSSKPNGAVETKDNELSTAKLNNKSNPTTNGGEVDSTNKNIIKVENSLKSSSTPTSIDGKENSEITPDASTNGDSEINNGCGNNEESATNTSLRIKEMKELEAVLQKFEAERVSVPCPFTAYMNIKYLIDNVLSKQDSKLAQSLQETCDLVWKQSKH